MLGHQIRKVRPVRLGFGHGPALLRQCPRRAHLHAFATARARRGTTPRGALIAHEPSGDAAPGDVPGVRAFDLVTDPYAAGAQDTAVVVQYKPLVRGVDRELGVQGREVEVGEAEPLGLALKLTVLVGDAHRTDMVALHKEELDYLAAVVDEALGIGGDLHPF